MSELDRYFDDPSLYLNRIRLAKGEAEFLQVDRDAIARENFLNDHEQRKDGIWKTRINAPLNALLNHATTRSSPPDPDGFIFHTAMAGSTLMARCLDAEGKSLSIKEPQAFGDLINARRLGEARNISPAQWSALVALTGRLLAKCAGRNEKVIIKNSNRSNALIGDIRSAFPNAKFLLQYSAMQPFMISMLKRGQPSWEYCRNLLKSLFADGGGADQKTLWNVIEYTDLQIAPIVWHLQFDVLAQFQASASPTQTKSLDCEKFLSEPAEMLSRVASYFDLGFERSEIEAIVQREVFARHAKDPSRNYSPEARANDHRAAAQKFETELAFVVAFSQKIRPDTDPNRALANPV